MFEHIVADMILKRFEKESKTPGFVDEMAKLIMKNVAKSLVEQVSDDDVEDVLEVLREKEKKFRR